MRSYKEMNNIAKDKKQTREENNLPTDFKKRVYKKKEEKPFRVEYKLKAPIQHAWATFLKDWTKFKSYKTLETAKSVIENQKLKSNLFMYRIINENNVIIYEDK